MVIRCPIITVMGHIDSGKTTLLDKIRGTSVASREAGAITQWAGCSLLPLESIKNTCKNLLDKLKINIEIPGFLLLDTPGHAAFNSIRKRGGNLADIAILVIDINEGVQDQTLECISILKQYKTPFVVAATKIDKIEGWKEKSNACFLDSFSQQSEKTKAILEEKIYKIVGQLYEHGFNSERFDRVLDFKKTVAIIPVSGLTGEGIPELLITLIGLSQAFLKNELEIKSEDIGFGTILEVKDFKGHGKTIDIILYDGIARVGDWIIIGAKEPIVTKIKALLVPKPLKEIRIEKEFENVDKVYAAAGIKIAAQNLENAVAGSSVIITSDESKIEKFKSELKTEISEIEIESSEEGIMLKADTLGSLEALIYMVKQKGIPIKIANVGEITKADIMFMTAIKDPLKKFILAFGMKPSEEIEKLASDNKITLIYDNIIYQIFEKFEEKIKEKKKIIIEEKLSQITRPVVLKLIPGCVFHTSNPAIVGVEILDGILKPGIKLQKSGREIGTLSSIQSEGINIQEAKKGERVAISIDGPIVGRHIFENDILTSVITKEDIKVLEEVELWDEANLAKKIIGGEIE
ncbi:MAG: translation initiation factor IF-2 [Candidatus Aenigmatarchaeota archaeon]